MGNHCQAGGYTQRHRKEKSSGDDHPSVKLWKASPISSKGPAEA
jgi:hypothetical protein